MEGDRGLPCADINWQKMEEMVDGGLPLTASKWQKWGMEGHYFWCRCCVAPVDLQLWHPVALALAAERYQLINDLAVGVDIS